MRLYQLRFLLPVLFEFRKDHPDVHAEYQDDSNHSKTLDLLMEDDRVAQERVEKADVRQKRDESRTVVLHSDRLAPVGDVVNGAGQQCIQILFLSVAQESKFLTSDQTLPK